MEFVAIDVETANEDMASICQIGIVKYTDGKLADEWVSLIDPEDDFSGNNIDIHGITESDVLGEPTFPDVVDVLERFLQGPICVCHTHFDRVSLDQAFKKYEIEPFLIKWLDSARVARRTWQDCAWSGYGLANVCQKIGYNFKHHDALEDAKAAAHVLLAAIDESKLDLESWLKRVKRPVDPNYVSYNDAIRKEGNPDGDLFGELLVFTGSLEIPRREAAELAANVGCTVAPGVTKKTTMLVVGDQDIKKLAGKAKSAKHLKAEQLIEKGQKIRILKESDFRQLASHTSITDSVQNV